MPSPILSNTPTQLNAKRVVTTDRLNSFFPEDYGAVGDGVTDDWTAITATIVAASINGGNIIFGSKIYAVGAQLTLDQAGGRPVNLIGQGRTMGLQVSGIAGTTIKYTGIGIPKVLNCLALNSCVIQGFTIDCGAASTGLYIGAAVACLIDQIDVKNSKDAAFWFRATTAGVFSCTFSNLSTQTTCVGAMRLDSQDISLFPADIAHCVFQNLNFYYNNGFGIDILSADTNLFIDIVIICINGVGAGEACYLRAATINQYGARWNLFIGVDGNTQAGAAKGFKCDIKDDGLGNGVYNTAVFFGTQNGLIVSAASLFPEYFTITTDAIGTAQANIYQLKVGRAFGGSSVLFQMYYDLSANLVRFQNHDPVVTRRGWRFSNSAGAGAEVTAFDIDADGNLKQLGRAVSIGEYTTPAYSAARLTASAGTWSVAGGAASVKEKYELTGHKLQYHFKIIASAVSNAGVTLRLTLPNAMQNKNDFTLFFPIATIDNGGARSWGMGIVTANSTFIEIFTSPAGGGFAISAGTTEVEGNFVLEIQ